MASTTYQSLRHGHDVVVAALVAAGADMDAAVRGGMTPLCAAAGEGHEAVVVALVAGGAGVDKALDGCGQGLTLVPISAQLELFCPPYNPT